MIHLFAGAQRWRDGRSSFRPHDDEYIDTRHFEIHEITGKGSDSTCRRFVQRHHYSGSYVAARRRYGLTDLRTHELVGVAVYSVAGGQHVAGYSFPFLDRNEVVCLGRLVLLDYVKKDGESWFVTECQRRLYHDHGIKGVVSFSDPVPRRSETTNELVMPGHVGVVYQACNALYTGRSKPETVRLYRDDCSDVAPRSLSKIRARARGSLDPVKTDGWEAAVETLVAHGARHPRRGELRGTELLDWLGGALHETTTAFRHPGKHRYLFGLDRRVRRAIRRQHKLVDPDGRYVKAGNHDDYPQQVDAEAV